MSNMVKKLLTLIFFVVLCGIVVLIIKSVIFVQNDLVPLGYDPGMYRAIHLAYLHMIESGERLGSLPSWIKHEPLRGLLSVVGEKLGVGIDYQLGRGFITLSVGVYLLVLRRKLSYGAFLVPLFLFSAIQFELYSYLYYKQLLGIGMMFLIFSYYNQARWRFLAVSLFLLVLLHRHTALISILVLCVDVLLLAKKSKIKRYIKGGFIVIPALIGLALYGGLIERVLIQFVKPLLTTTGGSWQAGDFLSVSEFTVLVWPSIFLLITALLLLKTKIWKKWLISDEARLDVIGLGVCVIRTILGLLNYKRGLVFFDLFLLAPVAFVLHYLREQKKHTYKILVVVFFILYGSVFVYHILEKITPRISRVELDTIMSFGQTIPVEGYIMVTDRKRTPWVMGYSQRKRISPGMSDDNKWTQGMWNEFRAGDMSTKCSMLSTTYGNQKLWIMQHKGQFDYLHEQQGCLKKIAESDMLVLRQLETGL